MQVVVGEVHIPRLPRKSQSNSLQYGRLVGLRVKGSAEWFRVTLQEGRRSAPSSVLEVSTLDEIGERDAWTCWICDLPVDPDKSVNDDLGPSIDRLSVLVRQVGKKKVDGDERLAHRQCNTKKGAIKPVIAWSSELTVFDPSPIIQSAERIMAKGGREVVARCASHRDATQAGKWLIDRLARLAPGESFSTRIDEGGGQFLLSLLGNQRR